MSRRATRRDLARSWRDCAGAARGRQAKSGALPGCPGEGRSGACLRSDDVGRGLDLLDSWLHEKKSSGCRDTRDSAKVDISRHYLVGGKSVFGVVKIRV